MEANQVFIVVGAFSFSFVLMNLVVYFRILKPALTLEKKGHVVKGTLIRTDRVKKSKSIAYYAVVSYRTLTGQTLEGRSVLSIRKYIRETNIPMEIIYNPDKEDQFMPVEYFKPKRYKRMMLFVNLMTIGILIFVLFKLKVIVF